VSLLPLSASLFSREARLLHRLNRNQAIQILTCRCFKLGGLSCRSHVYSSSAISATTYRSIVEGYGKLQTIIPNRRGFISHANSAIETDRIGLLQPPTGICIRSLKRIERSVSNFVLYSSPQRAPSILPPIQSITAASFQTYESKCLLYEMVRIIRSNCSYIFEGFRQLLRSAAPTSV
jgi:hypothetical protein